MCFRPGVVRAAIQLPNADKLVLMLFISSTSTLAFFSMECLHFSDPAKSTMLNFALNGVEGAANDDSGNAEETLVRCGSLKHNIT